MDKQHLKIVAKVNGKAITNYDVDQRAAFFRMVTNLDDTKANRQQIQTRCNPKFDRRNFKT